MTPRRLLLLSAVLLLGAVAIWRGVTTGGRPVVSLVGETMGTAYSITVVPPAGVKVARAPLHEIIEARLEEINRSMSTWDKESEISRINAAPAGRSITVSEDLGRVLAAALEWGRRSGGALDVTVGPLVNLWGFGPEEREREPTGAEIAAALELSGLEQLSFSMGRLTKKRSGMYLDFSALAKGYAVDELAYLLRRRGLLNYMVEIGGEVAVGGHGPRGGPWNIGIELPDEEAAPANREALIAAVRLNDGALATSGSYRRFKQYKSGKGHHIIDPRTGRPTASELVSVTVRARVCMAADAAATALMVMGLKEGMAWVEQQPELEALFLEAAPEGGFNQYPSSGFQAAPP